MAETNNLVILTFEGAGTAAAVYSEIERLEKEKLVEVVDAIIIQREESEGAERAVPAGHGASASGTVVPVANPDDRVQVIQTHKKTGKLAGKGAGIGFLAGCLLGGPIGGLAVGAGLGAIMGAAKDFGIDDNNIAAIKARLHPNTSALLVLGHANDRDALLTKLRLYDPQVVSSTLTPEIEKELRDRLASS